MVNHGKIFSKILLCKKAALYKGILSFKFWHYGYGRLIVLFPYISLKFFFYHFWQQDKICSIQKISKEGEK
jgi:hypothetical protein